MVREVLTMKLSDTPDGRVIARLRTAMAAGREVPTPTRGSGPVHCCGGHRERCLFGRTHIWSVWFENGKLQRTPDTFHCYDCGGVCTAEEAKEN
jgi:hypothetical protein